MADESRFDNPPIVELVIGAQFSPIAKMTTGHLGWFWRQLGDEWVNPLDGPTLPDQFELFDRPWRNRLGGFDFRLVPSPVMGRLMVGHCNQNRMIQLQASQLHFNWRKRQGEPYPSYERLIVEFEAIFDQFNAFVGEANLGQVLVNQWELTYVDAFPRDVYWHDPVEWSELLPGLFGTLQAADGLTLEHRAAEWSYVIGKNMGRLHITAKPGHLPEDPKESLLVQMTARGPVGKGGSETLRKGLDLGHSTTLETFLRITSERLKDRLRARS